MSRRRRKYEEAAGVVRLRWHRGGVTPNDVRAARKVLAEVWDADLTAAWWRGCDFVRVTARFVVLTVRDDNVMLADGVPLLPSEMVRRHAKLGGREYADLNLTLEVWPND